MYVYAHVCMCEYMCVPVCVVCAGCIWRHIFPHLAFYVGCGESRFLCLCGWYSPDQVTSLAFPDSFLLCGVGRFGPGGGEERQERERRKDREKQTHAVIGFIGCVGNGLPWEASGTSFLKEQSHSNLSERLTRMFQQRKLFLLTPQSDLVPHGLDHHAVRVFLSPVASSLSCARSRAQKGRAVCPALFNST